MFKKRVLLPGLAVTAATVVVLIGFLSRRQEGPAILTISGNIELQEVKVAFKMPGKLVELGVDEGDFVKAGALVARLGSDELGRQREGAQAELKSLHSRLAELQALIEFQTENNRRQVELRQAELRQARVQLEELLSGSRSQEIDKARAALEWARAQHDKAVQDWERAQRLFENEDISAAQFDQFKAAFEAAQASLDQAEETLDLIVEGPRREHLELARIQVARAQASLKQAQALRLDIRRLEKGRDTLSAEIERAQAQIAVLDARLEDTEARSPIDGVVLVKSAEEGEVLAAGSVVVTIGDLGRPWVRGYIAESDLGLVKVGGRVRVTSDSFPDKVFWGRLAYIASEAEFTPKQIQTREERTRWVYRVKVDIPNPEFELKLNMPVEAEIVLAE